MIRRYRVAFVCEKLYYVEEWRLVRFAKAPSGGRYPCTAHWRRWNSPVAECSSARIARRIVRLLNGRERALRSQGFQHFYMKELAP